MSDAPEPPGLSGDELLAAFATAAAHLRAQAAAVDAINVYPVPDGDTGSNMAATLREAVESARAVAEPRSVAGVLAGLAKGALYGARGNSGVILSQALRGLATGAAGYERFDAAALAAGLGEAARMAYTAVAKPVEGTMLTVLREAAEGAAEHASVLPDSGARVPCAATLAFALRRAETAERETPQQLIALAEAGVTDAGGEGVCVILRGLLGAVTGELPIESGTAPYRPLAELASHEGESFGYCTEFLVEADGAAIDIAALRTFAGSGTNRSVVVVGDGDAARVHVHADVAEAVLAGAAEFGRISRVKVDDMGAQNARYAATGRGATARIAVLALSPGPGFDALFRSMGAHVAPLGSLVKPAAREIAAAANALGAADVVVLPNHGNVILAARQASEFARCTITVVETETLPQGIAAALAFDPEQRAVTNAVRMLDAAQGVRTVEVTIAAADRSADGVRALAGRAIALVDGTLVASEEETAAALVEGLQRAAVTEGSLITIYGGEAIRSAELEAVRETVSAAFPAAEVETLSGGQGLYPFIASVES